MRDEHSENFNNPLGPVVVNCRQIVRIVRVVNSLGAPSLNPNVVENLSQSTIDIECRLVVHVPDCTSGQKLPA